MLQADPGSQPRQTPAAAAPMQELAPPVDPALLAADVAALPAECALVESGSLVVYAASPDQIPHLLIEIGRLRELTFRAVGEGTGRALDLDEFDGWYHHLFVWHRDRHMVAGSYRIGRIDEILESQGVGGMYIATLFQLSDALLARINPALELGRSFVRADLQKVSTTLLLLWRGIAAYVVREPRYRRVLGPVSIDRRYQSNSLQLMVGYLGARHVAEQSGVAPRCPYVPVDVASEDWLRQGAQIADVESLGKAVASCEPDGRGVPVLVRQYLRLGAEVLGFNVDPDFSDVVDALMLLDLERVDADRLNFFMGSEAADGFRGGR